ncbi:MAG TPA: hypothetical protein VM100_09175 [Longimicrobiales bacterium]|nr:hypothetical protein [Longimicrobiales bacterium]
MKRQWYFLLMLALAAFPKTMYAQAPTVEAAQQQLATAEARYRAAIAISPNMGAYHFSLALVLDRQGRSDEALAEYALAAKNDSMSARHRAGYGAALLKAKRPAEAITQLSAAVALDRTSISSRRLLSDAHAQLSQWREAALILREAAQLSPGDANLNAQLGAAEARAGTNATNASAYHDLSEFEDDVVPRRPPVFEIIFGVLFSIAGLILLAPVLGTLLLLATQAVKLPFVQNH